MKPIRIAAVIIAMGYATSVPAADHHKTEPKESQEKRDSSKADSKKKTEAEAEGTRGRKSETAPEKASPAPQMRPTDPLNPDPMRPGTPPTFPPRNESSPQTPVKPVDPTAPTIVK